MEPNYEKMFNELVARIETEYESAREAYREYRAKCAPRRGKSDHEMTVYYSGIEAGTCILKVAADHIKKRNGLQ